jgi:hypothetical protein
MHVRIGRRPPVRACVGVYAIGEGWARHGVLLTPSRPGRVTRTCPVWLGRIDFSTFLVMAWRGASAFARVKNQMKYRARPSSGRHGRGRTREGCGECMQKRGKGAGRQWYQLGEAVPSPRPTNLARRDDARIAQVRNMPPTAQLGQLLVRPHVRQAAFNASLTLIGALRRVQMAATKKPIAAPAIALPIQARMQATLMAGAPTGASAFALIHLLLTPRGPSTIARLVVAEYRTWVAMTNRCTKPLRGPPRACIGRAAPRT